MQKFKKIWQAVIICMVCLIPTICHAESVSLNWDVPTTNTDYTPLTDLAGFKIYQGTATGVYGAPVDVGNVLCYIVTGLTVGITYYFAATAYDIAANESDYSNEVSKLIASGDSGVCGGVNYRSQCSRLKFARTLFSRSQVVRF